MFISPAYRVVKFFTEKSVIAVRVTHGSYMREEVFVSDKKTIGYESAMNAAMKYVGNREIVFWGDNAELREYLKGRYGITVDKIVTTMEKKVGQNRILSSELQGKAGQYYVLFPKDPASAAFRKQMRKLGFKENEDYLFVKRSNTVLPANYGAYSDICGNVVQTGGCRVFLSKYAENCDIFVDEGFKGDFLIRVFGKGNVKVRIGKNCKSTGAARLFIHDGGEFTMGTHVSMGDNTKFSISANNRITVGDDCMFSYDILVFSGDGHANFDMTTGQPTNHYTVNDPKGSITFGNHVWVCAGAYILNRANIGTSCIIGANSTVKGDYPDYSVAAGNPARVVKTDVTWSRNPDAQNIEECYGNWDSLSSDEDFE